MNSCSILISSHKRPLHLEKNLQSLCAQPNIKEIEVHLLINGVDSETANLALSYSQKISLNLHHSPHSLSPGAARNFLISKATKDWLFFLDDDAFLTNNYLEIFFDKIRQFPSLQILGGPNLTPVDSSRFALLSGDVLAHFFGSFIFRDRYQKGSEQIVENDHKLILCNLWIRKSLLEKYLFNEQVICAEENLLLKLLFAEKAVALYCPDLFVYHHRRESWYGWKKQIEKFGRGRGYLINNWFIFLGVLSLPIALALMPLYFTFIFLISLAQNPRHAFLISLLFLSLHFNYFKGIVKTKIRSDSSF